MELAIVHVINVMVLVGDNIKMDRTVNIAICLLPTAIAIVIIIILLIKKQNIKTSEMEEVIEMNEPAQEIIDNTKGYKQCPKCHTNMLAKKRGIKTVPLIFAIIFTVFAPTLLAIPFAIIFWISALSGKDNITLTCPACGYYDVNEKQHKSFRLT